jgi:hypothetical protein
MCLNYWLDGGAKGQVGKSNNAGGYTAVAFTSNPRYELCFADRL